MLARPVGPGTLAAPAAIMKMPTRIDWTEASTTARTGSPPEASSGRIDAAIIGPSDESGPRTSTREGPNTAYATRHMIDV